MNQKVRALQRQDAGYLWITHVFADDEADAAQRRLKHVEAIAARKAPGFFPRAQVRLRLPTGDAAIRREQVRLRHKRFAIGAGDNRRAGDQPHAKAQSQPGARLLESLEQHGSLFLQHGHRIVPHAGRAQQRQPDVLGQHDQLRPLLRCRLDGGDQSRLHIRHTLRAKELALYCSDFCHEIEI